MAKPASSGGPTTQWYPDVTESFRSLRVPKENVPLPAKPAVRRHKTTSVTSRYVLNHCEMAAAAGGRQLSGQILVLDPWKRRRGCCR